MVGLQLNDAKWINSNARKYSGPHSSKKGGSDKVHDEFSDKSVQRKKKNILSVRREVLLTDSIGRIQEIVKTIEQSGNLTKHITKQGLLAFWAMTDCTVYETESSVPKIVLKSQWNNFNIYHRDDITLSLYASLDRYIILDVLLTYWEGPVSVAVYVEPKHLEYIQDFHDKAREWVSSRENVDLHFVPKQTVSILSRM